MRCVTVLKRKDRRKDEVKCNSCKSKEPEVNKG